MTRFALKPEMQRSTTGQAGLLIRNYLLLPRLISGEIQVREAENLMEGVA